MYSHNRQISAYFQPRPLKQHERQLISMIMADYPEFRGSCLDIGCADGAFLRTLAPAFPGASFVGIDLSEALIIAAREGVANNGLDGLIEFQVADAVGYLPDRKFDLVIASGILGVFEDFAPVLEAWLSWVKPGGRLYVFGRFNSRDVDTIVRYRNNYNSSEWETGLTSYSIHTVGRFLRERGLTYEFQRFFLDLDLPEQEDPIRTFTVSLADGSRLVLNGANTLAEHFFLTVHL
jgi:SAM-dependent methyltransferase